MNIGLLRPLFDALRAAIRGPASGFVWLARILLISVVVLLLSKWARNEALRRSEVIYYPKFVAVPVDGGKAKDADLALIWDDKAATQCQFNSKGELNTSSKDIITQYWKWAEQEPWPDALVGDGPRTSSRANLKQMAEEIATLRGGDSKTEGELFRAEHSMRPRMFAAHTGAQIFVDAIADRVDDGIFLNTLAASVLGLSGLLCQQRLGRISAKLREAPNGKIHIAGAVVITSGLFYLYTVHPLLEHRGGDYGPIHGTFWTEHFRSVVTWTQWCDGVLYIISGGTAAYLFGWHFMRICQLCRLLHEKLKKPVRVYCCGILSWLLGGPILGTLLVLPTFGALKGIEASGLLLSSVAASGILYFIILDSIIILVLYITLARCLPKNFHIWSKDWPFISIGQ